MLAVEATDLAVRILRVFNGPPADVWEEALEPLNAGQAGTTIARLTREHSGRWLSIAEFMNIYRTLKTIDAGNRPAPCEACSDSGWIEAPDLIEDPGTDWERRYTQVKPCGCDHGRRIGQSAIWRERSAS